MNEGSGVLRDAVALREAVPSAEHALLLRLEPHSPPRDEHGRDDDVLVGSEGPDLRQLDPPSSRRHQGIGLREEGAAAAAAAVVNIVVLLALVAINSAPGSGHAGRGALRRRGWTAQASFHDVERLKGLTVNERPMFLLGPGVGRLLTTPLAPLSEVLATHRGRECPNESSFWRMIR